MVGRAVRARGRDGTVEQWEPLGAAMCDALVRFEDGSRCWFASHELRPADALGPLPSRSGARKIAEGEALTRLRAIRADHVRDFAKPWPGANFGKAIVGMSIDAAIKSFSRGLP